MPIHLGKHPSKEGWLGFETDSHLSRTKQRLRENCLPCLTGLYEQLKAGAGQIRLREAWNCWKVTVVVESDDQCLRVLECFSAEFPGAYVYGKIGGGVGRKTSAVIFHAEGEEQRDALFSMLSQVLDRHFPNRKAFISRGCGNPYETLLGPWQGWKPLAPIRAISSVRSILDALRDSLYPR